MIREGDTLVCKKHYFFVRYNGEIIEYEPDRLYTVSCVLYQKRWYNPGKHQKHIDQSYNWIKFNGVKGNFGFSDRRFIITNDRGCYIWDYFISVKEWRKIKLERIKNSKLEKKI